MLQALRNCIVGAGPKMSDAIRKQITATLQGLLSSTDDTTRTTAAACLGALCSCLKEDELVVVLRMHLLGWYCLEFCFRKNAANIRLIKFKASMIYHVVAAELGIDREFWCHLRVAGLAQEALFDNPNFVILCRNGFKS